MVSSIRRASPVYRALARGASRAAKPTLTALRRHLTTMAVAHSEASEKRAARNWKKAAAFAAAAGVTTALFLIKDEFLNPESLIRDMGSNQKMVSKLAQRALLTLLHHPEKQKSMTPQQLVTILECITKLDPEFRILQFDGLKSAFATVFCDQCAQRYPFFTLESEAQFAVLTHFASLVKPEEVELTKQVSSIYAAIVTHHLNKGRLMNGIVLHTLSTCAALNPKILDEKTTRGVLNSIVFRLQMKEMTLSQREWAELFNVVEKCFASVPEALKPWVFNQQRELMKMCADEVLQKAGISIPQENEF